MGVESCILPLNDVDYFGQYIDFLLRYSTIKQDFRNCKHLLGVAELRCHWLVDYSWEAIAYISQGMHLYANNAYVTLFGFEGMAEVRSMPVAQLAEAAERKAFEAMSKAADVGNKPSNRLLITLRTLEGERMRAEVRFIPAVLKGKRCTQLHVRPLERNMLKGVSLRKQDNPWEAAELRLQTATPVPPPPQPEPAAISGMKMTFHKLQRLREQLPTVYVAEPEFRQKSQILDYAALLKQLVTPASRFRLDYWNLGQVVLKLSAQDSEKPSYLVFVSVGGAILNNETDLKRMIELLNAAPAAAKRIVLALQYRDCMEQLKSFSKVVMLCKGVGVRLAIDGVPDDAQALRFLQAVKPVLVRIDPLKTQRLPAFIAQLVEHNLKVIVPDVQDKAALKAVYATAAAYAQGGAIL
jgi:EAL domain-containing protein (putative c-di-GMP-specific phosphodiesterase class I)